MKIIQPKVELWQQGEDKVAHVTRCARICYGKDSGNNLHLVKSLLKNKHNSMFRHITNYYIIPFSVGENSIQILCLNNIINIFKQKVIGIDIKYDDKNYYIATNGNYNLDNPSLNNFLRKFRVDEKEFKNYNEIAFNMMRYTFCVVTQISTSRELNRVSPNNIAEQSTRYVYEDGTICEPHWLKEYDIYQNLHGTYIIYKNGKKDDDINRKVAVYIERCDSAFNTYKYLVKAGIQRQDARGVLPIDTATKCAYTYSIDEWRNIIDLRYYGTTGKPHPNCVIIAKAIKEQLEELGYNFK